MKVLILSQVFYPDVVAVAQYLTDFVIDLRRSGCSVKVLASRRGYDDRSIIFPLRETLEGIDIERIPSTYLGKRSMIARGIDAASFNLMLFWKLILSPRYDVVIGMTTPPLIATIGSLYCLFRKEKFVYWVMDLNPDEAIAAGIFKKRSIITRSLEKISRFTFINSDLIIALDHYMAERIEAKGISGSRIKILPPWAQNDRLRAIPHDENPFRKKHHLNGKFVIMYSGNHSICHPLDTLLEAARVLRDEKDIVFMFIGGGKRVADVADFKEVQNLANIVQLPYQLFSQLSHSLSAADVQVAIMGNDYVGIVHPSKIYSMLWIGRPFVYIGPSRSHIGELINRHKIGFQVAHGDTQELVKELLRIKSFVPAETLKIKIDGQALVQEYYSRKILGNRMIQWITDIVSKN